MYFYMWTGIQKHLFQEHASAWTVTNTSTHTQGISPWACSNADGRAGALGANFARRETALKVLGSLSKSSALTTAPAGPQHQSSIRHGGLTSLFPSPTLFFSSPQFFLSLSISPPLYFSFSSCPQASLSSSSVLNARELKTSITITVGASGPGRKWAEDPGAGWSVQDGGISQSWSHYPRQCPEKRGCPLRWRVQGSLLPNSRFFSLSPFIPGHAAFPKWSVSRARDSFSNKGFYSF